MSHLKKNGGESLNIKGSTISHVAAVHPGHWATGSPTERRNINTQLQTATNPKISQGIFAIL